MNGLTEKILSVVGVRMTFLLASASPVTPQLHQLELSGNLYPCVHRLENQFFFPFVSLRKFQPKNQSQILHVVVSQEAAQAQLALKHNLA